MMPNQENLRYAIESVFSEMKKSKTDKFQFWLPNAAKPET